MNGASEWRSEWSRILRADFICSLPTVYMMNLFRMSYRGHGSVDRSPGQTEDSVRDHVFDQDVESSVFAKHYLRSHQGRQRGMG